MSVFGDLLVGQFFRTTVTTTIAVGATTITVSDASGFPVPTGNKFFYLTLVDDNDLAEVVRISSISGLQLTLVATTAVQNGFAANTTRAELWLTAEAFEDMQAYILSLTPGGSGSGYEPDGITIDLNVLNELELKDATGANGIQSIHINDDAITTAKINNLAVTDNKLLTGIDAGKLINTNRTVVTESVERTFPLFETISAGLNMNHIAYTEVLAGNTPSGGSDGDIAIEWEVLP